MKTVVVYTDGGARGNPGPAGIGIHICDEHEVTIEDMSIQLGFATNNEAEYHAVIAGVSRVLELFSPAQDIALTLRLDSELVGKQILGSYRVKEERLKKLHAQVQSLLAQVGEWNIEMIPREQNKDADALANRAMDALEQVRQEE